MELATFVRKNPSGLNDGHLYFKFPEQDTSIGFDLTLRDKGVAVEVFSLCTEVRTYYTVQVDEGTENLSTAAGDDFVYPYSLTFMKYPLNTDYIFKVSFDMSKKEVE